MSDHPSNPAQVGDVNIAPTTTAAEDMVSHGQRRINLIWETTQAIIAVSVCSVTLFVAASMAIRNGPATVHGDSSAFLLLSNVFFLVVGTYFNRTNHTAVGGVSEGKVGR